MSSSSSSSSAPVIVVGGGLAGLSAALTVLEHGGRTVLIDKKPSLGGNSVKASSGINGAGTESQKQLNIADSVQAFYEDTVISAGPALARPHLITALTSNSAPAIEWLTHTMNVDLCLVSLLGGHRTPRTHRGKGGPPGWAMVSSLVKRLSAEEEKDNTKAKVIKGSKVVKILQDSAGKVEGVVYETAEGEKVEMKGSVIISTGGFGADYSPSGYISTHRPDLLTVPTTNGDHATGDGHRLVASLAFPGLLIDMDQIQVHPTGFIDPAAPDAKAKFLAAEALRGVGGLLVNKDGERFVNEVEKRDHVTEKMGEVVKGGKGPVRLLLGVKAAEELKAHCDFYVAKGLMKKYADVSELAKDMGVAVEDIRKTIDLHSLYASGKEKDPFGKDHFHNADINPDEPLLVALMTPVVHYTMGGIQVDARARVVDASGAPIPGLFAAGEAIGGVHGKNRLGGSSLLEAVVFGRIAGEEVVNA